MTGKDLKAVGQFFMTGIRGHQVDAEARALIRELQVGGIILFARNLAAPEQVRELTGALQAEARASGNPPLLVAVDQEGGPVQRLREPFTRIPSSRKLGESATPAEVRALARKVGAELASVGITMNLAPVLDVARSPSCPLWERSFGPEAERVAALGAAALQGYLEAGVMPVAKHFPGLGDTAADSHAVLPQALDPDPRREKDLYPFRQAIRAGVPAIMTAHLRVPSWDELPATLSPVALTSWLRGRLGFEGVIMTDDLEMGAITGSFPVPEAAARAFVAGADLLLLCSPGDLVWEAADRLRRLPELGTRLEEAQERLGRLRRRLSGKGGNP